MSHHNLSSALRRLLDTAPNRRARRALGRNTSATRPVGSSRRRVRPRLETLEDRITPNSTFAPTVFTDGVSSNGQVNTLRDAILAANRDTSTGTDTVQLQAGTYTLSIANTSGHENAGTQGDLNISNTNHTLVIQGIADVADNPETVINQTALDRVFQILNPGTTVIFKNVIIEGGDATDNGGSGAASGSSNAEGGGILDDGGNVTFSNVIVKSNQAVAGTTFAAEGGGLFVGFGGSVTVSASTFQGNGAYGGAGAAAANSQQTHNTGGNAEGGGIYTTGKTTIDFSNLSGNFVTGGFATAGQGGNAQGGGIFADGETKILNSTLSGNTLTGGNSSITAAGGADGGGAFIANHGIATITSSTLSNNVLNAGKGDMTTAVVFDNDIGGDAEGGGVFSEGQLTLISSTLTGNKLTGGQGTLDNDQTSIAGNIGGDALGGGVYAKGVTNVSTSTLSNNALTGGQGTLTAGITTSDNGGLAAGGGIDFSGTTGATATISASTMSGNTLQGGKGGSLPGFAEGGGASFLGGISNLVNSTVASNFATGGQGSATQHVAEGGGVVVGFGASATFTNDTVSRNQSEAIGSGDGEGNGGGIANNGTATLKNTLVAVNFAIAGTGDDLFGTFNSSSDHNLIGNADGSTGLSIALNQLGTSNNRINPQLGPLASNGGPTQTMALLPGSPAINGGDNSAQTVTGPFDQRGQGFPRVAQGHIDIGAFEFQASPPPSPPPSPPHGPPPSPPGPPPSLFQALISLYLDGIELAAVEQANTAAFQDNFALASALGEVLGFFGNPSLNAINASIAFYDPFAGPFGPFVVQAGETALQNAVQSL